jgi:hypothetical protein
MAIGDQCNSSNPQSSTAPAGNHPAANQPELNPNPESQTNTAQENIWREFGDPETTKPASHPTQSSPHLTSGECQACWSEMIMGTHDPQAGNPKSAQGQIMGWLEDSADAIPGDISSFPDVFQTTRFWEEVKAIESPLLILRAVSEKFCSGSFLLVEAVDHIGRTFGWDEQRLAKWKQDMENLLGMKAWLPTFTHECDYLTNAFPLGTEKLEQLRNSLLQSIEEPHRFLDPKMRDKFDDGFLEFKKNYMDFYFVLHEDALHAMGSLKKDETKVDAVALRNLELLSGLPHMDQGYLNRVKLFAKWIQHRQCDLPLHQILEHYPRCYCNFSPGNFRHPTNAAAQINGIVQEGVKQFRAILRSCGHWARLELKAQPIDDYSLKQITALLSDGPMIPLKAPAIKVLNRILAGNSGDFLSEIRKAASKTTV